MKNIILLKIMIHAIKVKESGGVDRFYCAYCLPLVLEIHSFGLYPFTLKGTF